ncbi:hypothetical protein L7F22_063948 [Adiantum nelumboides]|nr:hypothetical protein [Adiantum nelumboides]
MSDSIEVGLLLAPKKGSSVESDWGSGDGGEGFVGKLRPRAALCARQVNRLEISPDKQWLAAAGNPHIRLFEVNTDNSQHVIGYDAHSSNVTAVGFQCEGKWMYSGSEDGTVKIWDLRAPGCQREYESGAAVNTVVLHPNQTELISGDQNGNIRVWDLIANSCSCELVPEVDTAIRSLTVMWDGSLVVASNNHGTCYVWRVSRKKNQVSLCILLCDVV